MHMLSSDDEKLNKSIRQCPICKTSSLEFVEKWNEYKLYKCGECDIVFSHPFQNPGREWYEKSYDLGINIDSKFKRLWHFRQFLKEPVLLTNKLEVLDIGCGTGFLLNELNKMGHHSFGIDFNQHSIEIARMRYGLNNIYPLDLQQFIEQFPSQTFDIVTFFEVLEHLDNPNEFIERVRFILKPKGYIGITLPNRGRFLTIFKGGDSPPHHLTRWSVNALEYFVRKHGFEVIACRVQKMDVEVISHYLELVFSFGMAARYAQIGVANKDQTSIKIASTLGNVKSGICRFVSYPISILTKYLPLQGTEIYCLAKLR